MNFGEALSELKSGMKVCRSGWNGKGMWLKMRPGFDLEKAAEEAHDNWVISKQKDGITSRLAEWGEEFMQPYRMLSERAKDIDRGMFRGNKEMTLPYIYIEYPAGHPAYPKGSRVPWLASQTDLLADDWEIVQ